MSKPFLWFQARWSSCAKLESFQWSIQIIGIRISRSFDLSSTYCTSALLKLKVAHSFKQGTSPTGGHWGDELQDGDTEGAKSFIEKCKKSESCCYECGSKKHRWVRHIVSVSNSPPLREVQPHMSCLMPIHRFCHDGSNPFVYIAVFYSHELSLLGIGYGLAPD